MLINNKKLLIIGMTPNRGGTETFAMNLFYGLRRDYPNLDITFLNIWDKEIAYSEEIIKHGGHILNYKIPTGFLNIFIGPIMARSFFLKYSFDIVHINANYLLPSYFAIQAKKSGIKNVIFHAHNSSYGDRSLLKKIMLKIIAVFQRIKLKKNKIDLLAASSVAGEWMFKNIHFTIIPNGIDTKKFGYDDTKRKKIRKELNIPFDSSVIISVARFEFQKNHDKILSVFQELAKNNDSYLLLIGEGSQKQNIENKILKIQLSSKVKLLGSKTNIADYLSASDIMIMPSRYEGLPFSAIEAQANGLSLVVSREAFNQEVNITNKVTFLSNSSVDDEWAEKIVKIIDHSDLSNREHDQFVVNSSMYSFNNTLKQVLSYYHLS